MKNKADIIDYVKQKSIYNEKLMIDNLAEIFSWNALNAADLKVLKRKLFNDYNKLNSNLENILEEQIVNVLQLVFGSTRGIAITEVIMTYLHGTEMVVC